MKYIFLVTLVVLIGASLATRFTEPDVHSKVPVLYWVTDPNPARAGQIKGFEKWLVVHGYTTKDGGPACELKLDSANRDMTKQIIQGVSGVADDIWDVSGSPALQRLHAINLVVDVTQAGKRLGFDPSHTYPSIRPQLTIDGKQYMFPCNVATTMLWVNKATFKKYGQPVPPLKWSFKEFEKRGLAFVKAANKGLTYRKYFFVSNLGRQTLYRSLGLSMFNETLTACALNDPRYVRVLKLLYKWTHKEHLLPTAGDVSSFATASGYGGAQAQLFASGNYAMIVSGRYMLIKLRDFTSDLIKEGGKPLQLTVVQTPNGGFPNMVTRTRAAAVYQGSKHKKLAVLFLAYLASRRYNMKIVEDADALPPNPKYTKIPAFLHPPKWPNEWGVHQRFADAENTIAIGLVNSPFVLTDTARRDEQSEYDRFMNNQYSAQQAAEIVTHDIDNAIARRLEQDPKLKPRYERMRALQKRIDSYRRQGKRVPINWIKNTFYRVYYKHMGWTTSPRPEPPLPASR